MDDEQQNNSVLLAIQDWQHDHDTPVTIEATEHGYPLVDLRAVAPDRALQVLEAIDAYIHPAYHGMHNNEFRHQAGMPEVQAWAELDPSKKSQDPGRPLVYATTHLRGGLVHALLEHKLADQHPITGETYSLIYTPSNDGKFIEASPYLAGALQRGEDRFTDGLLYILPRDLFEASNNSTHELSTPQKVKPLAVIRVGKTLGPKIVTPESLYIRYD